MRNGECEPVRFDQGRLSIILPRSRKPIVRLDVMAEVSPDSPNVLEDDLWQLELYGARSRECDSSDSYHHIDQVLSVEQASEPVIAG
ncbi:hypothetical protein, partial [Salmonella sp. s54395]|uniref:hypothetical protein n=1 Tax=Salmonella sp. s54395 TaxID=3159664 RepID=UPI003980C55C